MSPVKSVSADPAGNGFDRAGHREKRDNVTRLLCAGAHLDPQFRRDVIGELVKQGHRRTAPAYGYDCVPVLAHACVARRQRRIRNLVLLTCLIPLILSLSDEDLALQLQLLAVWWAWVVVFVDRLITINFLLASHLRAGTGSALSVPYHPIAQQAAAKITREQRQPRVFYSGFTPFVGAGILSRSWSFSVVLRPAGAKPVTEFTPEQLVDHTCAEVTERLKNQARPTRRIEGLTARKGWYSTLLRQSGFDTSRIDRDGWGDHDDQAGSAEAYRAARRYACVSIGSWDQELVTSIFVGFDIRGDTLHTELHSYVLLPIRAEFHEVDRLPDKLTVTEILAIAVSSPLRAVGDIFRSVSAKLGQLLPQRRRRRGTSLAKGIAWLVALVPLLSLGAILLANSGAARWIAAVWLGMVGLGAGWRQYQNRAAEREAAQRKLRTEQVGSTGRKIVDYGARTSIRELAASDEPHHFFQSVDQDKYTKIIERRVTDFIIDFLERHNIDISEFETRRQVVLNYGIMQTGDGQIINAGSMATGSATATTTTAASQA